MVSSEGTCAAFYSAGRGIGAPARPLAFVAPLAAATAATTPTPGTPEVAR
jgi:hypothetical protein